MLGGCTATSSTMKRLTAKVAVLVLAPDADQRDTERLAHHTPDGGRLAQSYAGQRAVRNSPGRRYRRERRQPLLAGELIRSGHSKGFGATPLTRTMAQWRGGDQTAVAHDLDHLADRAAAGSGVDVEVLRHLAS